MSVYKNEAGRRVMAGWYQHFLDGLAAPVEHRDIETDFGRTHVLSCGPKDADVLVCFHGVMGSAPSALSQIEGLVPHFRVVFPDTVGQPGRSAETYLPLRGDAYGRWAEQVLDGMGLEQVRCLGVSMGGYVALKLAQRAPARLTALSLWVPGGIVQSAGWDGLRLGWATLAMYLWPSDDRMKTLYDELFTDCDPDWFAFYRDSMANLRVDRRMPQLAPDDAFAQLTAPVQLFAHERDVLFPADRLIVRAQQLFPNLVEVEVIPELRHVPPFSGPDKSRVLERVRVFLREAS